MQDIPDLLETLRRAPKILSQLVKAIPEDKLDVRRGEGFWTLAEHVSHLAHVQPMLLARFERFMHEDHPEFVPYLPSQSEEGPAAPPRMSMASALGQLTCYRERQLLLLEGADETAWKKTATHPEYESYSLYILARHVLMHDYWHMYRMEELWLSKDAYLTKLD
ncbi:MAG: DinB family protein [Desulfobacteraceae bacterium]|nr:DinB family protein [Desulfobacteraceae bacterium]